MFKFLSPHPCRFIPFIPIFMEDREFLMLYMYTPFISLESTHPISKFYLLDSRPRRARCGLLALLTPEPLIVNDLIPPLHIGPSQMLFWLLIRHTQTPFTNSKSSFPYPSHRTPFCLSLTSIGLLPPHPIPETVSHTPYILCTFHHSFDLPSPRTQSRKVLLYYVTCHLRRWHQHTSCVRTIAMFVTRQYMTRTHQVGIVGPFNSNRGLLSTWSIF